MAFKQCLKLFKWRHWNCSALQPEKPADSPYGEALKGIWLKLNLLTFHVLLILHISVLAWKFAHKTLVPCVRPTGEHSSLEKLCSNSDALSCVVPCHSSLLRYVHSLTLVRIFLFVFQAPGKLHSSVQYLPLGWCMPLQLTVEKGKLKVVNVNLETMPTMSTALVTFLLAAVRI